MQRFLRPFSFSLMGVIILLLIAGSVVEQIYGTAFAVQYIYTAPWTIALWMLAAVSGLAYICSTPMWKQQIVTFVLHFSFVIILGGAMVTHLWGKQGDLHLRLAEPQIIAVHDDPFYVTLTDFYIEYYPGSMAPADFVSEIEITDNGQGRGKSDNPTAKGIVSMNHIFSYRHNRFYQSQYDSDGRGVTLRYSYDPWGIGITYTGYALLLLSVIGFFFRQRTLFRALLKQLSLAAVLLSLPLAAEARTSSLEQGKTTPPTVSKEVAEEWGNLYVYYNDRVCPMRTLAVDFTTKLYGKPSYKGLNAEQVLCGWLFFYDKWAEEPCIKIKGKDVRAILGMDGKYARLNDYVGDKQYKLAEAIRNGNKNARAADEKMQLISMVCTGRMMCIFPLNVTADDGEKVVRWYSWSDRLPAEVGVDDWQFVTRSMDFVALCIAQNAQTEAADALRKIRQRQRQWLSANANGQWPSDFRFASEKLYQAFRFTRPMAMACATLGLLLFIISCALVSRGRTLPRWASYGLSVLMFLVWGVLTFALVLRWISSGHVPLANGFETMQFLAWTAALFSLVLSLLRRSPLLVSSGILITGMTLMVSMMSASNPQITHLMPVLQSPLLTMHVAVIMIAYCLLAFVMINGVAALCVPVLRERMMTVSQVLLYPAVFCLTIGIFLGAVWANISWGRYWGWDPKEVWALITMLVYALLLHTPSVKWLQRPLAFHIYSVVAFLFVLFTYFGVNFVLGGLHSYANA